jgi:hypothetical protein
LNEDSLEEVSKIKNSFREIIKFNDLEYKYLGTTYCYLSRYLFCQECNFLGDGTIDEYRKLLDLFLSENENVKVVALKYARDEKLFAANEISLNYLDYYKSK